eukprot:gb/GECG01010288.1/.p1 GENE.gb/GECG01010288.1/~~gb/GECG01010288.1/.p1  ORF type:complete len:121 (+),score=8.80 gb/GECG01010288.1/:1-363(+)
MDIEAAQALWKSDNVDEWRQALDQYPYVLEEFSKTVSRGPSPTVLGSAINMFFAAIRVSYRNQAPRRKTLAELHKWIENDLRPRLSKDRYLSQNDLSKVRWNAPWLLSLCSRFSLECSSS